MPVASKALRYRVGRLYQRGPGNRHARKQPTAPQLAKEYGVAEREIRRYREFANAVDAIAANLGEGFKQEALTSPKGVYAFRFLIKLAQLSPEIQKEAIESGDKFFFLGRKRARKGQLRAQLTATHPFLNEKPRCVSEQGYRDWLALAEEDPNWSAILKRTKRHHPFCLDCTPQYASKMRVIGKCSYPQVQFKCNDDGVVYKVVSLNSR